MTRLAPVSSHARLRCGTSCRPERSGYSRISPSTSSRFSSMCAGETSDSRFRRSSGSVFDGGPVEVAHLGVPVALLELLHLPVLVLDLRVDLPRQEVARAERFEQLAQLAALDGQQLEDQERRNRARVGAVEVVE